MSRRRKAREIALQTLYAVELSSADWKKVLGENIARRHSSGEALKYSEAIVEKVVEEKEKIDSMIEKKLENWKMERVSLIDRLILRIALAELVYFKSTPKEVIINEAVDIAHRFSSSKAGGFVNGILDRIAAEVRN